MLSLRQKAVEEYIDMHCANFPFPPGVKSLFIDEELEHTAVMAESARNLLKEVNKVKLPKTERISAEQFVEYYNILMTEVLGETIVHRLDEQLERMTENSYDKDRMMIFKKS